MKNKNLCIHYKKVDKSYKCTAKPIKCGHCTRNRNCNVNGLYAVVKEYLHNYTLHEKAM